MATILITGAAGYIGSIATQMLLERGDNVIALDNLSTGNRGVIDYLTDKYGDDKLSFFELDTRDDLNPIFTQNPDISSVLHYAAVLSVSESMSDPQKYFSVNVTGTNNLLTTMLKHNVKQLVFSSTAATYGKVSQVPISETEPTNPVNVYGASKRMAEQIIDWYSQTQGLRYVIFRYFNVTGATDDGELGDSRDPSIHLVQAAIRGILGLQEFTLTNAEVDTPDHTPIRDYVNIVDLDTAHLKAIDYLQNGGQSETINLGTGTGNSVLEIIDQIEKITGKTIPRQKSTPRQGEDPRLVASITKAKQILDWEPQHTLKQSVESLIKWYQTHPHGWTT